VRGDGGRAAVTLALAPRDRVDEQTAPRAATTHLGYVDLLRGFSIVQVVLIHSGNALLLRGLPEWRGDAAAVQALLHLVAHDATVYFAIISGLLYGHLFARRPYRRFLAQRLSTVALPYAVITAVLTLVGSGAAEAALAARDGQQLGHMLVTNLVTGATWNTLWYIPVILVLYLVSPALLAALRGPHARWRAAVLMLAPLLASRTGTAVTPATIVYFAGAYSIGLAVGLDLEAHLCWLKRRSIWLGLVAAAATVVLILLYAFERDLWHGVSLRESAFYAQRATIALLLLLWARSCEAELMPAAHAATTFLASTAFGVYFVHGPILRPIARLVGGWVPDDQPWWALLLAIAATFAAGLLLSLALVLLMRALFGRRSRLLIGA
jgi:peptidoglycan/LPS O-acetylase OafA/YrhL